MENKNSGTNNNRVKKTNMEIIFGEKATKLFPLLPLITILSSVIIKSTSLYLKLLATVMWGIVIFSSIWIVYKAIRFKILKKKERVISCYYNILGTGHIGIKPDIEIEINYNANNYDLVDEEERQKILDLVLEKN